jgi:hypothetical protein
MSDKRKRPAVVWVLQIILGLLSLMLLFMWFMVLSVRAQGGSVVELFWTFLWGGLINLIVIVPSIGLFIAKPWGRWSSIVLLGLFTAFVAVGQVLRIIYDLSTLPPGPQKSGYMVGSVIGAGIFCAIPAYVAYRMVTSEKVRDFFAPPEQPDLAVPPPPIFDDNTNKHG